jgi:hypothetical protein
LIQINEIQCRLVITGGLPSRRSPMSRTERPRLSELTAPEVLERAAEYRRMAATASTAQVRAALLRLAERLDRLAGKQTKSCIPGRIAD